MRCLVPQGGLLAKVSVAIDGSKFKAVNSRDHNFYLDSSGPAHMRYSVRRLRRKLPKAIIILGCWVKDIDPTALEVLRDNAKADLVAASLGEAVKLCIAGVEHQSRAVSKQERSATATVRF